MKYEKIKIGDLVILRQGFAINKKTNHHISTEPTSLHLLRIGDMKDGNFSIYVKDTIPDKFIAKEDDVIFTRTGQVGLVFRGQRGIVHNNCFTVTTKDNELLLQEFIFYALQEKAFYEEAISRATGAAQPDLPHGAFSSIPIFLPCIKKQKKIVDILQAYDDLIENNQKQIKLLEEAAQRLYKEWFVDFRFPGYEDTKFIDNIPEGWRKGTLEDIAVFKRGKTITRAQVHKGNIPVVAGGKEPAYYHNKSNTASPVITVSASGNAGFVRLYYQSIWASDCSFLDISETSNLYFIYCYLKYKQDDIYAIQKGACQQHVNAKEINSMQLMAPTEKILMDFKDLITPVFGKINFMNKQISLSIQARDRLLPKLMSGEIEV